MSVASTQVLALGIDAASPALLDAWIADGSLPNLAALCARGLVGRTRGLEGFFVGATWPSMYTGRNPARHGLHYQRQLVPGSYRLKDCAQGAFVEGDPFWRALSRAGKRVAVLDVPLSKREPELCGAQVVEWGSHDSFFGYSTLPPELAWQIEAWAGPHRAAPSCDAPRHDARDYREFLDSLVQDVHRKAAWSAELLARGPWDLFMQVFTESHCAGHQCWHLHDDRHPAHDPAIAAITGDPLREVYSAIDHAVGALVEAAGDARVVVFAAHGMSHHYGAHFILPDLLFALGVAAPPRISLYERARDLATHLMPRRMRALAVRLRTRLLSAENAGAVAPALGVDVDRSSCFPLSNGLAVGGIRLNLAGREPRGTLTPGDEAVNFVARLEADLLAIVDEATGAPLVTRVLRTRDLYAGEHLDNLPDLLVEWNEALIIRTPAPAESTGAHLRARSPKIGIVEGRSDYSRSGEHRSGGWFVAAGEGIPVGRLTREPALLDLAPTLAAMLDVELVGADGEAIEELVSGRARASERRVFAG